MIKTHFQCAKCKSWRPFHRFPVFLGPGVNDGWMTKTCRSCFKKEDEMMVLKMSIAELEKERTLLRTAEGNGQRLREISLLIRKDKKFLKQLEKGDAQRVTADYVDPLADGELI